LLSGYRGQPVKLRRHLSAAAAAFRRKGVGTDLPQSISGLWRADLFLGSPDADRWVGTTVKINRAQLTGDRGLRVAVVPASEGRSDAVYKDVQRNLVVCPLPYDGSFVETFYKAWEVVAQFLNADAQVPKEVALSRPPARTVARYLADRREFEVVDVIEALGPLSQPELLVTAPSECRHRAVGRQLSDGGNEFRSSSDSAGPLATDRSLAARGSPTAGVRAR